MPYNVDPKQQAVRDEVKAFAEKEIHPISEEMDRMGESRKFPTDLYRKIGTAGFIGYAMMTLDSARIGVAAQGIGIAQRALDESVTYAKKRVAFGAPIAKLQAIQWMIADMSTRLEAARCLTYKVAMMQDKGERFSLEAAQVKLYASETAGFCVDRAMQIHASYGYIDEYSVIEKLYRDQRVLEIYEGTSEVQRLVIAGNVIGR